MQIYQVSEDNTYPIINATLQRNEEDIDLSNCDVDLIINNENTGEQTNSGHTACIVPSDTAAAGVIQYQPEAGDFPLAGRYVCDAKITTASGKVEIVNEQLLVVVRAKNSGS